MSLGRLKNGRIGAVPREIHGFLKINICCISPISGVSIAAPIYVLAQRSIHERRGKMLQNSPYKYAVLKGNRSTYVQCKMAANLNVKIMPKTNDGGVFEPL
jgi:hypothetical protein